MDFIKTYPKVATFCYQNHEKWAPKVVHWMEITAEFDEDPSFNDLKSFVKGTLKIHPGYNYANESWTDDASSKYQYLKLNYEKF